MPSLQGLSSNTRYQIVFGLERLVDEVRLGCRGWLGATAARLVPLLLLLSVHCCCCGHCRLAPAAAPVCVLLLQILPFCCSCICCRACRCPRCHAHTATASWPHATLSSVLCQCLLSWRPHARLQTPCLPQTIARRIPAAAYFTTLVIRFANNVVGGENFIDMARWAGVQ